MLSTAFSYDAGDGHSDFSFIALMKNQVDAMRNFSEEDGVAHFINSSLNKSAIDQVKDDIRNGRTKLLYVAPES